MLVTQQTNRDAQYKCATNFCEVHHATFIFAHNLLRTRLFMQVDARIRNFDTRDYRETISRIVIKFSSTSAPIDSHSK